MSERQDAPPESAGDDLPTWLEELLADPSIRLAAERPGFVEKFRSAIGEALEHGGRDLAAELMQRAPQMLSEHKDVREGFEQRLTLVWGEALDLFETFHVVCLEAGESCAHRLTSNVGQRSAVVDALVLLHVRACRVASEVLTLLRAGYASGAHARWRTLHELAVVAHFITKHGDETARRYLLHDAIQAHKATLLFETHHEALGYEALEQEEIDAAWRRRDELVTEFGTKFAGEYGWAEHAVGRPDSPKHRVQFSEIEADTGLDHLRAHYRMASNPVHAGPRGLFFDLGLPTGDTTLLAGASQFGLADPGDAACISLFQVTTCLLAHDPDFDDALALVATRELLPKVGEAFLAAHQALEGGTSGAA